MGNPTGMKREKERQKQDRAKEKAAKRELRRAEKADRPPRVEGEEDPQIAGIVPGPQPVRDDD
jgi:hypothetical protein